MVRDFPAPHRFPANGKCHHLRTHGHGTTTIADELCPCSSNTYAIELPIEIAKHYHIPAPLNHES